MIALSRSAARKALAQPRRRRVTTRSLGGMAEWPVPLHDQSEAMRIDPKNLQAKSQPSARAGVEWTPVSGRNVADLIAGMEGALGLVAHPQLIVRVRTALLELLENALFYGHKSAVCGRWLSDGSLECSVTSELSPGGGRRGYGYGLQIVSQCATQRFVQWDPSGVRTDVARFML